MFKSQTPIKQQQTKFNRPTSSTKLIRKSQQKWQCYCRPKVAKGQRRSRAHNTIKNTEITTKETDQQIGLQKENNEHTRHRIGLVSRLQVNCRLT